MLLTNLFNRRRSSPVFYKQGRVNMKILSAVLLSAIILPA
ncbi:fimbrial assembly protein, partial [Salmonella enterica]|nr:fimbrial assembly protein [Salmonella enterica]